MPDGVKPAGGSLERELRQTDFSKLARIAEHTDLYRMDPEKAHLWDSTPSGGAGFLPTLLLTTTGRKSGEPRSVPLIYGELDRSYVVVASKEGLPHHPFWFLNLQADPACELMVGPRRCSARARVIDGEDRDLLWRKMVGLYPPYAGYQARAGERQIPVVVLDPVD